LKRQEAKVTSEDKHHQHSNIPRPEPGEFARNEFAILGTTCDNIKACADYIIKQLSPVYNVAYVDADHKSSDDPGSFDTPLASGAALAFTDKINYKRLDYKKELNVYEKRAFFNNQELVLINGNHFKANKQIVIVDAGKPLEKKLDRLTDVRLILLKDKDEEIPRYLKNVKGFEKIPVFLFAEDRLAADFLLNYVDENKPALNGLVLSGGNSTRMRKDKGSINYHGTTQRKYLYNLLNNYCVRTYVSLNDEQAKNTEEDLPFIKDTFLNLGPTGGILSAFQSNPDRAWLTVACDLPYLSEATIKYLIEHRNPAKAATCFLDPAGEFPEPLITIWEPKAYHILLIFLSQGYTCPRKVLINSDIQILQAPDTSEFKNVNEPEQYQQALQDLKHE
jgi:molybdopterin-guanine dinucleotide biosynthesis protein A